MINLLDFLYNKAKPIIESWDEEGIYAISFLFTAMKHQIIFLISQSVIIPKMTMVNAHSSVKNGGTMRFGDNMKLK